MFARAVKVLVATSVVAQPASAQAHRRLEFAPALGVYTPARHLTLPTLLIGCPKIDPDPCSGSYVPPPPPTQNRVAAVGGRVTAWFGNRGGIEGGVWYAPSGVTDQTFGGSGNVVTATLRVVGRLVSRGDRMSVLLMGGPALIHRFGDAYAELIGATTPGGMLGIGLDVHPGRRFGFRATIEDYMYSLRLRYYLPAGFYSVSNFQHDVVLSLSMSPFGQRGERR